MEQLLIKDLCARLPYHLLGRDAFGKTREMKVIYPTGTIIAQEIDGENCSSCGFIPYLRPLSSMTDEEREEYRKFSYYGAAGVRPYSHYDFVAVPSFEKMDWLHAHHFDYRGLIPKGLALEAPEGIYNTKTE